MDGVFSMNELYLKIVTKMDDKEVPPLLSRTGRVGIRWAGAGGEARALSKHRFLAADGIENVIDVLEKMDNYTLPDLDFVELDACNGGCVGGVMTMENAYIAKARLLHLEKGLPLAVNWDFEEDYGSREIPDDFFTDEELTYSPPKPLDEDIKLAFEKRVRIQQILETLPALDCGSCGAPTCRAFAEDIVRGYVTEDDCIVRMKKKQEATE